MRTSQGCTAHTGDRKELPEALSVAAVLEELVLELKFYVVSVPKLAHRPQKCRLRE